MRLAALDKFIAEHPRSVDTPYVMLERVLGGADLISSADDYALARRIPTEFPYFPELDHALFILAVYELDHGQAPSAAERVRQLAGLPRESPWLAKAKAILARSPFDRQPARARTSNRSTFARARRV